MAKADPIISLMADEVLRDIEKKNVGFHRAFSWAAHRRGIRHRENWESREQYNIWFTQVLACLSLRKKKVLTPALEGERPWQHGNIVRDPTISRRRKWRPDDPWGHDDQANFIFSGIDAFEALSQETCSQQAPLPQRFTPRGRIKPGIRTEPHEF